MFYVSRATMLNDWNWGFWIENVPCLQVTTVTNIVDDNGNSVCALLPSLPNKTQVQLNPRVLVCCVGNIANVLLLYSR